MSTEDKIVKVTIIPPEKSKWAKVMELVVVGATVLAVWDIMFGTRKPRKR